MILNFRSLTTEKVTNNW